MLLSPATVSLIFFLAIIWNGFTDLFIGYFIDKTPQTRFGQYRPYLIFGAMPLGISMVLAFSKPPLNDEWLALYVGFTYFLLLLCYSAVYMPFTAFIVKLTSDSSERSSLSGYRIIMSQTATLLVAIFTLKLVALFGQGDDVTGFQLMAFLYALLGVVVILLCAWGSREHRQRDIFAANNYGLFDVLSSIRQNYPFQLVIAGTFLFATGLGVIIRCAAYYAKYFLNDADFLSTLLVVLSIAAVFIPIWVRMSHATSKRFVWLACCVCTVVGLVLLKIMGDSGSVSPVAVILCFSIVAIGVNGFLMNYHSMLADTIEYGEWKTGIKCQVVLFALLTFCLKASSTASGGIVAFLLSWFGFVANETQSAEVLHGIEFIMTGVPAIAILLSAAFVWFYPIDSVKHDEIVRQLNAKNGSHDEISDIAPI